MKQCPAVRREGIAALRVDPDDAAVRISGRTSSTAGSNTPGPGFAAHQELGAQPMANPAWRGTSMRRVRTLVLWDIDHTLISTAGISDEIYGEVFHQVTGL